MPTINLNSIVNQSQLDFGPDANQINADDIPDGTSKVIMTGTERIKLAGIEAGAKADHGNLAGLADDDHSQYHNNTRGDTRYPNITSQAGAPASTPAKIGDLNIDTTNLVLYVAKGIASSADWMRSDGQFEDNITTADAVQTHFTKTIAIADNTTKMITAKVSGISSTGTIHYAGTLFGFATAASGVASLFSSTQKLIGNDDASLDDPAGVTLTVTGTTARVSVTGKAATTIYWHVIINMNSVSVP